MKRKALPRRRKRIKTFRRQITIYLTPKQARGLNEMADRRSSHPATIGREAIQFFLASEVRGGKQVSNLKGHS